MSRGGEDADAETSEAYGEEGDEAEDVEASDVGEVLGDVAENADERSVLSDRSLSVRQRILQKFSPKKPNGPGPVVDRVDTWTPTSAPSAVVDEQPEPLVGKQKGKGGKAKGKGKNDDKRKKVIKGSLKPAKGKKACKGCGLFFDVELFDTNDPYCPRDSTAIRRLQRAATAQGKMKEFKVIKASPERIKDLIAKYHQEMGDPEVYDGTRLPPWNWACYEEYEKAENHVRKSRQGIMMHEDCAQLVQHPQSLVPVRTRFGAPSLPVEL